MPRWWQCSPVSNRKGAHIMAVQDDINAAVTAIEASGADTSALNTAVAGLPAVTDQLAAGQAAVTALAPPAPTTPADDTSAGTSPDLSAGEVPADDTVPAAVLTRDAKRAGRFLVCPARWPKRLAGVSGAKRS
jgi:hypothetical protein